MKLWNYIILFTTLSIILKISGIDIPGTEELLTKFGMMDGAGNFVINSNNSLRAAVVTLLGLAVGAALVIGFVTKSQSENYVILPLIIGVAGVGFGLYMYISFGYSLITYSFDQADWVGYISLMIFGPLSVGFIISLVEFFRGTD